MHHYDIFSVDRLYNFVWGDSIQFGLYDKGARTIEEAVAETKRRIADALFLDGGKQVLEVASGYGATARYLAGRFGCRVVATNYSQAHARRAEAATAASGLDGLVSHEFADYHDLPFADGGFDVHLSQESLVHSTAKDRYFSEAFRVLKPGGLVAFTDQTTDRGRTTPRIERILTDRHGSPDLCGAGDFIDLMERAGFETLHVEDWSAGMRQHFANLVTRIEERRDELLNEVDPDVLAHNEEIWRLAVEVCDAGMMGWGFFVGRKPE